MRLISIIGTRPQYIKIKPLFDCFRSNSVEHYIVDTGQHFTNNVSKAIIDDLSLDIDTCLSSNPEGGEIEFISKSISNISKVINDIDPDMVLVYGDTNSTFCASLSAYKKKVSVAHIEAGERCFDKSVPEEINRIFVDEVSSLNFCSSYSAFNNLDNGIYCGDLEYELLNNINPDIRSEPYVVLTMHRKANMNEERVKDILSFCSKIPYEVIFFSHHSVKPFLSKNIPKNISILEPCKYTDMVKYIAESKFVITDSGSINKTTPFFGKNALILRNSIEWKDTVDSGFSRLSDLSDKDIEWAITNKKERNRRFYMGDANPSSIILLEIGSFCGSKKNET